MPKTKGARNRSTLARQETAAEDLAQARESWQLLQKQYLATERAKTPEEREQRKTLEHRLRALEREMSKLDRLAGEKEERDRRAGDLEEIRTLVGTLVENGRSAEEIRETLYTIFSKEDT